MDYNVLVPALLQLLAIAIPVVGFVRVASKNSQTHELRMQGLDNKMTSLQVKFDTELHSIRENADLREKNASLELSKYFVSKADYDKSIGRLFDKLEEISTRLTKIER